MTLDTYQIAARTLRERVRDKSYRAYPMGGEAGHYLRWKRGSLTKDSYRDYEAGLDKLARFFPDLEIKDFEPPVGTDRLFEHLEHHWGDAAERTYNKNHSILSDFFKFMRMREKLHGDPMLPIPKRKERAVRRDTFNVDQKKAILEHGPDPENLHRDRCILRLILHYGLRKGAWTSVQPKDFDHARRRLTFRTKGGKVQTIPIPEPEFWNDLERWILDTGAEPDHYMLSRRKSVFWKYDEQGKPLQRVFQYPDKPMGAHGAHDWWYGCLARAGVVPEGTTSGERPHKGRHSAGQSVLDKTGNIKAVQKLLGHSDPATTMNTYVDWDDAQLEETMREVLGDA